MSTDEELERRWAAVSPRARDTMKMLGNFGPTFASSGREVKGWFPSPEGGVDATYFDSDELRAMAEDLTEVADWLDKRAAEERGQE